MFADKLLFTWLSLVMSMMVSFCAVLFPTDEILNLIESVSVAYHYLPKLPRNTGTTMKYRNGPGINVLCGCGFYWEGTDEW